MKKNSLGLIMAFLLFSCFHLQAASSLQIDDLKYGHASYSIVSRLGQSASFLVDQTSNTTEISNLLGVDEDHLPGVSVHAFSRKSSSYSTNLISYQYTTDGWLQHVGIYADCIVCTNIEGPREGVQFIIANNGAIMDMSHFYTEHKDHVTNKYSWGEINTYANYQVVKIK